MEFHVIIPARYQSSRMAGKVLVDIKGKPLLQYVYERAVDSGAESVTIATDHEEVAKAAEKFGAQVCMTDEKHQSGTERIAEAVAAMEFDEEEIIVGLQVDHPLIPAEAIRQVATDLDTHDNVRVVSLCEPITVAEQLFNPNIVKVVLNRRGYAMLFTRAAVPWEFKSFADPKNISLHGHHFRHIGLYAYRAKFLPEYIEWPESPLEELESLEQLRILWNGGRIHMSISEKVLPPSVHTKEDIQRIVSYLD